MGRIGLRKCVWGFRWNLGTTEDLRHICVDYFSVHNSLVLCSVSGLPYPNADHYWPMNNISLARTLSDVRGFTKTLVFNGLGVVQADQLGTVVQLDGKDDWIFASGFRGRCVNDPTFCTKGLSVAFWIRFQRGKCLVDVTRVY